MMPIDFTQVNATLTATETEIAEHEAALAALAVAQQELADAQTTVTTAQTAVSDATATEGGEKADVVTGITNAINQLTALLQTLQV